MGETEQAFQWLEKSIQDNEVEPYWLKVEPEFASLYGDSRWHEMLDKVGFPEWAEWPLLAESGRSDNLNICSFFFIL